MADHDEANALLDARLLAYLNAYQEYTVLTVELQSVLREGHIKLAHARRELSRTTSTSALSFGTTCVPSEFRALLRVGLAPLSDGQPDAPPVLELRESKGALVKDERRRASGGGLRKRRQGGGTAAGAAAAGAALPEDDHEARAATRRISRIHGGFRVPDDGGWQVAAWGEAGMAIDDRRLPRGQWLKLPAQSFTLDIADDAVSLDCQAFRAQSLVLKRPASESIWYVVLRHRVDFALTTAGFDVATGLSGTQFGFGVVYADGEFRLIPGMAGNVTSGGKPVDSHRRLEAGMSIEVGRFSLVFQPLMVRDIAR